ncbi:uncharacterized protein [Arachis hypogaea]|uniref:uncharacterized protein n=1 Tax=Arachis hypogaea TaxID=3818 RepID=UPI003B223787
MRGRESEREGGVEKHRAGLPGDISKKELFELFSWTGRIDDIYLSRKSRNGVVYLFAFIRYTTKGGALKAISEMDHMRLRGKEIYVGEANYRRDSLKRQKAMEVIVPWGITGVGEAERKEDNVNLPEKRHVGKDVWVNVNGPAQTRDTIEGMSCVEPAKDDYRISRIKEVAVIVAQDNVA